eukprot:Gb_23144 [translate_table: standard]
MHGCSKTKSKKGKSKATVRSAAIEPDTPPKDQEEILQEQASSYMVGTDIERIIEELVSSKQWEVVEGDPWTIAFLVPLQCIEKNPLFKSICTMTCTPSPPTQVYIDTSFGPMMRSKSRNNLLRHYMVWSLHSMMLAWYTCMTTTIMQWSDKLSSFLGHFQPLRDPSAILNALMENRQGRQELVQDFDGQTQILVSKMGEEYNYFSQTSVYALDPEKTPLQSQVDNLQATMANLTMQLRQPLIQQNVWCQLPGNTHHTCNKHPDTNTQQPSQWCEIRYMTLYDTTKCHYNMWNGDLNNFRHGPRAGQSWNMCYQKTVQDGETIQGFRILRPSLVKSLDEAIGGMSFHQPKAESLLVDTRNLVMRFWLALTTLYGMPPAASCWSHRAGALLRWVALALMSTCVVDPGNGAITGPTRPLSLADALLHFHGCLLLCGSMMMRTPAAIHYRYCESKPCMVAFNSTSLFKTDMNLVDHFSSSDF